MPGQNDYNLDKEGELQPGLGKDELSPEAAARMKARSALAAASLRQEIETKTAELSEKERELEEKQRAHDLAALDLKKRETALRRREEALAKAGSRAESAPDVAENSKTGDGAGTGQSGDEVDADVSKL